MSNSTTKPLLYLREIHNNFFWSKSLIKRVDFRKFKNLNDTDSFQQPNVQIQKSNPIQTQKLYEQSLDSSIKIKSEKSVLKANSLKKLIPKIVSQKSKIEDSSDSQPISENKNQQFEFDDFSDNKPISENKSLEVVFEEPSTIQTLSKNNVPRLIFQESQINTKTISSARVLQNYEIPINHPQFNNPFLPHSLTYREYTVEDFPILGERNMEEVKNIAERRNRSSSVPINMLSSKNQSQVINSIIDSEILNPVKNEKTDKFDYYLVDFLKKIKLENKSKQNRYSQNFMPSRKRTRNLQIPSHVKTDSHK